MGLTGIKFLLPVNIIFNLLVSTTFESWLSIKKYKRLINHFIRTTQKQMQMEVKT